MMMKADQTDQKIVTILGSRVHSTNEEEVLKAIGRYLEENTKFSLVTPNPEIILLAREDKELQKAINDATFSIPDGVGLKLADLRLPIIHGRKLFLEICKLMNQRRGRVYLLGGGMVTGTSQKAKEVLEKKFPNISLRAADGPRLNKEAKPITEEDKRTESDLVVEINQFAPDILFVAFGAPKQEKWMMKWLPKLKVGGVMVIGGTLDYLAGSVPNPPKWLEKLELEWFWRLLTQRKRLGRILRAVVVFPVVLVLEKIKSLFTSN